MSEKRKWIGLAEVYPSTDGCKGHGDHRGAFVNVIGLAVSESDFQALVCQALADKHFVLFELQDIELLDERLRKYEVDDDLLAAAEALSPTDGVRLGAFHNFPLSDSIDEAN